MNKVLGKSLLFRAIRSSLLLAAVAFASVGTGGITVAGEPDPGVPEIAIGAAGGAMTLLAGGMLLLRERFRTQQPAK